MLRTVSTVLIDGVAPFEFGVVCEVFGIDRTDDGCRRSTSGSAASDPASHFRPTSGCPDAAPRLDALVDADLVAVPAARIRECYPPAVLDALRLAADRGATLLSVCSGAYLLGAAGLLDGRKCTMHWHHAADFAARFPKADVDPDVLFVDDGNIISSAGTAAGIDACLHLVRRELGRPSRRSSPAGWWCRRSGRAASASTSRSRCHRTRTACSRC